jgi:hypothetical protein
MPRTTTGGKPLPRLIKLPHKAREAPSRADWTPTGGPHPCRELPSSGPRVHPTATTPTSSCTSPTLPQDGPEPPPDGE